MKGGIDMFDNIFRKYDLDNLYIGVVTVYEPRTVRPSCVKVDVPPGVGKISYVTILNKLSNEAYIQISNQQSCFYYGENYNEYSNFPVVKSLMSLRDYYKKYRGRDINIVKPLLTKNKRRKILEHVQKKVMVI